MPQMDAEEFEKETAAWLRKLGYAAAADVLDAGLPGTMSIPRSMADTRDGRESIIGDVQEAFEDERIAIIVIEG